MLLADRKNVEKSADVEKKKLTTWQKIVLAWNILTLAFYCFYCIYFIASGLGSLIVNIVLLSITVAYLVLFIVIQCVKGRKGGRFRGASKRVYKFTRKITLLVNTIVTGGAIINMGVFANSFIITVLAVVMIVNLALNIVWLIFIRQMERRYGEKINSLKSSAKQFASGVKSLFKKSVDGSRDEAEEIETAAASEADADMRENDISANTGGETEESVL